MSRILLKTLTSVHIGSGNKLVKDLDFITTLENGNSYINVLDENKMADKIGDENIGSWAAMINSGHTVPEIMHKFAPNTAVNEYIKYKIESFSDEVRNNDTLLEIIRDVSGRPYIPGSSIKGAIRTAILSTVAQNKPQEAQKNYTELEKNVFGASPNSDVFRFITLGDSVMPSNESVIAVRLISMNIRNSKDSVIDNGRSQLEEVIREGEKSYFTLKIDERKYSFVRRSWPSLDKFGNLGVLDSSFASGKNLFGLINAYTTRMLESELEIWEDVNKEKSDVDEYLDNVQTILNEANQCNENECVLRIGHGSGWRFTTGAWTERLKCFDDVRRKVHGKRYVNYQNYIFPKTRRVDFDQEQLLGFVKLTIEDK
ncbi:MAG: type III-A CRISPR-associated RAMP protein Csm5 [Bacteroidales bacterium]|jgi:CRISPR/Cas system CSM-associated protein Csm5 (group 7 of RAMP superfamily)|nr:type III-A CRISPR-associated RAMP protein Csm5 [Bacteroidales bacterium]MCI2133515.1 type III-A CRISPR-associated RAMP protein Csm5 [Bacteroidales bacterium]